MQIHELSRRRRSDEGFMDIARGLGDAAGVTKGQAASAGILDKDAKLAAVRKNSDMKRVAAQLAAGWTAEAAKLAKAAPAAAEIPQPATPAATPPKPKAPPGFNAANVMKMPGMPGQPVTPGAITPPATKPLPEAVGTYNKKTGAANLDGKTMTSLSDLPPAIQQQIQAKQQALTAPAATTTPAPAATTTPAPAATTPAKPGAPPGFNAANIMQMPGMQPAGKKPAPAATTPPKPGAPPGFNAANVMKMPGMPGQPVTPGAITPGAAKPGPAAPGAATPPTRGGAGAFDGMTNRLAKGGAGQPDAPAPAPTPAPAASAEEPYWIKFLEYVNKKTAIRDASTYQMIGLKQIQDQSGYKNELDAAKAKILQAYKAGQDVTPAATEYILIAMAGAQLISSKNRAGVELEQPEVDPNNPDAAAGATGADGAAADDAAADGAAPGAAPVAGGKILDIGGVQAVFKNYGVDPAMLSKLGTALQQASGTNAVTKTGNGTVDNMLRALGFKVT